MTKKETIEMADQAGPGKKIKAPAPSSKKPNAGGNAKETQLKKTMANLKKENAEFKEKYIRMAAEFDNYKKMMGRELDDRTQRAKGNLIMEFLTVLDDLDRTMAVISKKKKPDPVAHGVELIHSHIKKLLHDQGVEEIGTVGVEFDLDLHEALMMVENKEYASHIVVEVHQKGYKMNGRVLRHAKVAVNK